MKQFILIILVLIACENKPNPIKQVAQPKSKLPPKDKLCGDYKLKPGQKVYIDYLLTLLPAVVIANDTTNHVVEYMIRDYYDNTQWDYDDHLWLVYCHKALKRN